MEQKPSGKKRRSTSFYQSQGLAIGVALGLIFGAAMDNIGAGLVLGIAVGLGLGRTLELQAKKKGIGEK